MHSCLSCCYTSQEIWLLDKQIGLTFARCKEALKTKKLLTWTRQLGKPKVVELKVGCRLERSWSWTDKSLDNFALVLENGWRQSPNVVRFLNKIVAWRTVDNYGIFFDLPHSSTSLFLCQSCYEFFEDRTWNNREIRMALARIDASCAFEEAFRGATCLRRKAIIFQRGLFDFLTKLIFGKFAMREGVLRGYFELFSWQKSLLGLFHIVRKSWGAIVELLDKEICGVFRFVVGGSFDGAEFLQRRLFRDSMVPL